MLRESASAAYYEKQGCIGAPSIRFSPTANLLGIKKANLENDPKSARLISAFFKSLKPTKRDC